MHSRTIFLTCFLVAKVLLLVIFLLPNSGKNQFLPPKTIFAGAVFSMEKTFFPSSGKNLLILGHLAFLSTPSGGLGATYTVHVRLIGRLVVHFLYVLTSDRMVRPPLFRDRISNLTNILRNKKCSETGPEQCCSGPKLFVCLFVCDTLDLDQRFSHSNSDIVAICRSRGVIPCEFLDKLYLSRN